jgi:arylsulfatase A-like enzyme
VADLTLDKELLQDVGFSAPSTFGGVIPTPTLDRIAGLGLRYDRFHTTALCSQTRAALLTGRNPDCCFQRPLCPIHIGAKM